MDSRKPPVHYGWPAAWVPLGAAAALGVFTLKGMIGLALWHTAIFEAARLLATAGAIFFFIKVKLPTDQATAELARRREVAIVVCLSGLSALSDLTLWIFARSMS